MRNSCHIYKNGEFLFPTADCTFSKDSMSIMKRTEYGVKEFAS